MSSILKLPKLAANPFARTEALDVLGAGAFAEFSAVRVPGEVLWCNFELARELGFDVPRTNQLTPALHDELIAKLSLRAITPDENVRATEIFTLYADRYGGDGVSPGLGSGRAGFLPEANLYIKGLGFTPLFRHNDNDDFVHSHGGVHLEDCMSEAIFGEVDHNLFELGANRLVAIIDQQKFVIDPSGRPRHFALAIRTGAQLRPGHLLAKRLRGSRSPLEMFVNITRATKQLIFQKGSDLPDLSATMLRVIDDHALTAADSFRWRVIHGALSPSNMDVSGAMLDLPTQSTQPRTAPIFKLDYVQSAFGTEHKERGYYLAEMYRRILRATDAPARERFNLKWINVSNQMDLDYARHLQVKLLKATGLTTHVAQEIQQRSPELAKRFSEALLEMARLRNPGKACVARQVVRDVSVVDVFNLLGNIAPGYFEERHLKEDVIKHLAPLYKGNRFHVAAKKRRVEQLAAEFEGIYRELLGVARAYYESRAAMESSICRRAAFENRPMEALYCFPLYQTLNRAIDEYKATGNAKIISNTIDTIVEQSVRNIDRLWVHRRSLRII